MGNSALQPLLYSIILVQQCLMLLGRSTIRASRFLASLMDPRAGNAQFTGDVCNRLSAGLGEPYRLALTLYIEVL